MFGIRGTAGDDGEAQVRELIEDLDRRYVAGTANAECSEGHISQDSMSRMRKLHRIKQNELKQQLHSAQQRNVELEQELLNVQALLGDTRAVLLQKEGDYVDLKTRSDYLEFERQSTMEQRAAMMGDYKIPSSYGELENRLRETQTQLNFERAANARQKAELEDAHRRYMTSQKAVSEATAEIAKLQQVIEQARLQSIQKDDKHQRDTELQNASVAAATNKVKELQEKYNQLQCAYDVERQSVQKCLAAHQLSAMVATRSHKAVNRCFYAWRSLCIYRHKGEAESELLAKLSRTEAQHVAEATGLQQRLQFTEQKYHRLQRNNRLLGCLVRWKDQTKRSLKVKYTNLKLQSENSSAQLQATIAAEYQQRIDLLKEALQSKSAESQYQAESLIRMKARFLHDQVVNILLQRIYRAFQHWWQQCHSEDQQAHEVTAAENSSVPSATQTVSASEINHEHRQQKMESKLQNVRCILSHLAFAWKERYLVEHAFFGWKDVHFRAVITRFTTQAAGKNQTGQGNATTERLMNGSPNLWRRWRLENSRAASNAVKLAQSGIATDADTAVALAIAEKLSFSSSPKPLSTARRQLLCNTNSPRIDDSSTNSQHNPQEEAILLQKALFLSPVKLPSSDDASSGSASHTGLEFSQQQEERAGGGEGTEFSDTEPSHNAEDLVAELYSDIQAYRRQTGAQILPDGHATSRSADHRTRNTQALTTCTQVVVQEPTVKLLNNLVIQIGQEGMIHDMIARLTVRIEEAVYQTAERLFACVDADFRDFKLAPTKLRPLSKHMRQNFSKIINHDTTESTLRWLLVLYLRAYATILREQAGDVTQTHYEGSPADAYREVLRDLTTDLAEQVLGFRTSKAFEANRYHHASRSGTSDKYSMQLDTGAGPREYWKILSHGMKGVRANWSKTDTEQQLWRLAVCVRCQSRDEGLFLQRDDPQRRLLDKTVYALILYYAFLVIWDERDILVDNPNEMGLLT